MNAQLKAIPAFARETCADVVGEIMPLLEMHYHEVSHHKDKQVGCAVEMYEKMERAGILRIYTLRLEGRLVGYGVYTVFQSLHYADLLEAKQDTLFLMPVYRQGLTGLKFIKWIETQLRQDGVEYLLQHGKFVKDIEPIWQRLGYEAVYYIYGKRLDHGNQ